MKTCCKVKYLKVVAEYASQHYRHRYLPRTHKKLTGVFWEQAAPKEQYYEKDTLVYRLLFKRGMIMIT